MEPSKEHSPLYTKVQQDSPPLPSSLDQGQDVVMYYWLNFEDLEHKRTETMNTKEQHVFNLPLNRHSQALIFNLNFDAWE